MIRNKQTDMRCVVQECALKIQKYKIQKSLFSVICINIKTFAKSYCMTRDMYNIYNIMGIKRKVIYNKNIYFQILCLVNQI